MASHAGAKRAGLPGEPPGADAASLADADDGLAEVSSPDLSAAEEAELEGWLQDSGLRVRLARS